VSVVARARRRRAARDCARGTSAVQWARSVFRL